MRRDYFGTSHLARSAVGYKRLFSGVPAVFRCQPESRPSSGNVRFAPDFVGFTSRSGPTRRCRHRSGGDPQRSFIWDASSGERYDIRAVQEHFDHSGADTTKVCIRVLNRGLSG